MIWMFDTDILIHFVNRKPGYERIARRMPGRSPPGELRLWTCFQMDDFPCDASQDIGEIKTTLLGSRSAGQRMTQPPSSEVSRKSYASPAGSGAEACVSLSTSPM
jgi:hypothetical protein